MRIVLFEDPRTRYSFELRPPSRTNNTCCKRTSVLQYAHAHYTANQPRSLTHTLGYHYRTHAYAYTNEPRMFAPQRPPIHAHWPTWSRIVIHVYVSVANLLSRSETAINLWVCKHTMPKKRPGDEPTAPEHWTNNEPARRPLLAPLEGEAIRDSSSATCDKL